MPDEAEAAPVLSDHADAVAAFALRHAIESIEASGGPLLPFIVTASASGGDRHLRRFMADELEEAVRLANQEAERASEGDIAAVAWDGYVTSDGDRKDAVFIRLGERGATASFVFHQRYALGEDALELFDELRFAYSDLPLFQGIA